MKNKSAKSSTSKRAPARAAKRTSKNARATRSRAAATKKAAPRKRAAVPKKAASKRAAVTPKRGRHGAPAKKGTTKQSRRTMTPAAQKKLATKHFQELLKEKQLRNTQSPAWQMLEHPDHSKWGHNG